MSGHILIDRGNRHRALRSLRRAGDKIAKGISILIFPEGTRSPDGRVRELKKGPFLLALLAQVPIVPVAIEGSRAILAKGSSRVTTCAMPRSCSAWDRRATCVVLPTPSIPSKVPAGRMTMPE